MSVHVLLFNDPVTSIAVALSMAFAVITTVIRIVRYIKSVFI